MQTRSQREIISAIATGTMMFVIIEIVWHTLPRPGGNGSFIMGLAGIFCGYRLLEKGNPRHYFSLRTLVWVTPLLVLQLALQAMVATGITNWD